MSVVYNKQYSLKCVHTGDDSDRNVVCRLYWGCRKAQEGDKCATETVTAFARFSPVIMKDIFEGIVDLNKSYNGKINIHTVEVANTINKCITIIETTAECTDDDLKTFMQGLNKIFNGIGNITLI